MDKLLMLFDSTGHFLFQNRSTFGMCQILKLPR